MAYKIIREVGCGGMGKVFEATDTYDGSRVALKMMSAKAAAVPDYRSMFDLEVSALRKLSHPSIVRIVGDPYSDSGGNLYLPMEFVEGRTISQTVMDPSHGPYSEAEAVEIFSKLLDVFSYIHSHHCIHRDVKPSNIMIRPNGSVCVIDFGIAKDTRTSTGKTIGHVIGTDGYMSPEQAGGLNIDTRTDIYSLGCLLHYMLTGSHAVVKRSNDYDTICAILENDFPRVSDCGRKVSEQTQDAILRAVNKDMTRRFQTAGEFKSALVSGADRHEGAKVVSVGRRGCNINIDKDYVSKHHLDIYFDMTSEGYLVTISDNSTNGTGVDGRLVRHDTFDFHYFTNPRYGEPHLPVVMLAGLPEYTLDWDEVLRIAGIEREVLPPPPPPPPDPPPAQDKLSTGLAVLAFLIPLAGWIMGASYKKKYPNKAKKANKMALWGFLFNYIIMQVIKLAQL